MASRPAKKRKKDVPPFSVPETERRGVSLKLCRPEKEKFKLESSIFINIVKREYVAFNATEAHYLYHICSVLFQVHESRITLYHFMFERELDDDDPLWEPVESDDVIKCGQYLLVFDRDAGQFSI